MNTKITCAGDVIERLEQLGEMANIPPTIHRLPLQVKFNVLQPGDKELPHDARVKVFPVGQTPSQGFSIRLSPDEKLIQVSKGEPFLRGKDLNAVLDHLRRYRNAYIAMWHDSGMDQDGLRELMDKIDRGEEI